LPHDYHAKLYQSHTGDALAHAFHEMLIEHGLENKVSLILIVAISICIQ
jgi:hypothetical protein